MLSTLGKIIFIHLLRSTVIYDLLAIHKFTSVLPAIQFIWTLGSLLQLIRLDISQRITLFLRNSILTATDFAQFIITVYVLYI
mgnify:CR=1 FL=1